MLLCVYWTGCDGNFTLTGGSDVLVVGSEMPYPSNSMCTNTLTTDVGMCIRVDFAAIDIEESEDCVNDSLVVSIIIIIIIVIIIVGVIVCYFFCCLLPISSSSLL